MEHRLLDLVRAAVMPAVTLTGWGAVIYMLLMGQKETIPDWFQVAVVGNTAWWFASLRGNGHGTPPGGV